MVLLVSFLIKPPEKVYRFNLTENQLNNLWNTLEFCKGSIQSSQSPAIDVKRATINIDSLENTIGAQYIKQRDTTTTGQENKTIKK